MRQIVREEDLKQTVFHATYPPPRAKTEDEAKEQDEGDRREGEG